MKKFVIVGSGSAGLIAAGMIKTYWKDDVDITVIHDKSQGSIAVGESTTPYIHAFLTFCGISEKDLIRDLDVTIKLGINFKNWIPDTEYFHGFGQISGQTLPKKSAKIFDEEVKNFFPEWKGVLNPDVMEQLGQMKKI